MRIIANVFAAGAFIYAGVLMVSSMAQSVRGIFSSQETEQNDKNKEEHEESVYRVVKVRVKPRTSESL